MTIRNKPKSQPPPSAHSRAPTTTTQPRPILTSPWRRAQPTQQSSPSYHSCCATSACSMLQRQQYTSFVVWNRQRSSSAKVAQKDSNPLKSFSTLLTSNVFANAASQVACRTWNYSLHKMQCLYLGPRTALNSKLRTARCTSTWAEKRKSWSLQRTASQMACPWTRSLKFIL